MNIYHNVKWSKEFGAEMIQNYKAVKKVFLEANVNDEILSKIQNIIANEKIAKCEEFIDMIEHYKIFNYSTDIDFIIQRLNFEMEKDNTVVIKDCVVIFLTNEKI